jgi:hypothetical protein
VALVKLVTITYRVRIDPTDGIMPARGHWVCSGPRAKVAYEIAEDVKVASIGCLTFKLKCLRHSPADIPEGATVHGIVWDRRKGKKRR